MLEIGAGHGSFTETVLGGRGLATVTEISTGIAPTTSATSSAVTPPYVVLYDTDGNACSGKGRSMT